MVATHNSDDIIELLNNDFSKISSELFEICMFYATPPHRLSYLKLYDEKVLEYVDFQTGDLIQLDSYSNFDCFQFVWFVLQKLAEYKIIKSDIKYYEQTFQTIEKILDAIDKKYLVLLKSPNQLNCGVVFYLTREDGWETPGKRHAGFYFTKGDYVEVISNHKFMKGVGVEKYTKSEFVERFTKLPCYISGL